MKVRLRTGKMGINSLFYIIKKNFILFWRSKISTFAILLAPVLIVLFATYAFNSSALSGVVIAVNSNSYTSLTEEILSEFEEQNYIINKLDSNDSCINSVKSSESQICVIFPDDLSVEGSVNDVIFYVDHSRINLAYTLVHSIESKIMSKASDLGVGMAQNLIDALLSARDSLSNQKTEIYASITDSDEIIQKADTSSQSDINNALGYLEDAEDLCDGIEGAGSIKDKIGDSINILKSSQISSEFDEIKNKGEQIHTNLESVYSNLDSIINSINNVNVLEAKKIVSPINTKIESINPSDNNKDYLLPIILSLIALFGGILLGSTYVLRERKTKAYFRNFITPTKDFTFIIGAYLTCLIILFLQFTLIFTGLHFLVNISILNIIWHVALVLFVSLTVFIFLGMLIGYLFKSDESTILGSVFIASVLMFFSNTILPIESTSGFFRKMANLNPLVVSNGALKKLILFDMGTKDVVTELIFLGIFFVCFLILTYIGLKITKRNL